MCQEIHLGFCLLYSNIRFECKRALQHMKVEAEDCLSFTKTTIKILLLVQHPLPQEPPIA